MYSTYTPTVGAVISVGIGASDVVVAVSEEAQATADVLNGSAAPAND